MVCFFGQLHLVGFAVDGHVESAVFLLFHAGGIVLTIDLELIVFHLLSNRLVV